MGYFMLQARYMHMHGLTPHISFVVSDPLPVHLITSLAQISGISQWQKSFQKGPKKLTPPSPLKFDILCHVANPEHIQ